MTDQFDGHGDDELEDELAEAGAIGVGMGGSCPSCRAPVDLGQEFCLECGAPIRFTPRQRRRQRAARPTAPGTAAPQPPARAKVPWIPILVVLALIGGGIAFALTDGNGSKDDTATTATTEEALPEITNSVPERTSPTNTVTLQDCDPAQPLSGTEPTIPGGVSPSVDSLDGGSEQIPELSEGPSGGTPSGFDEDPFADDPGASATAAPPSTTPESGGGTVTVDQSGNLCSDAGDGALDGEDEPLDPADTSDPATPSGDTSTSSGEWPTGRSGWTVIVFGYPTKERATQSALDLQQDGFTDGGVLFSSNFKSLCPGFHVVYSGIFTSEADARKRQQELEREGYVKMYPREIRNDGAAPDCATTS